MGSSLRLGGKEGRSISNPDNLLQRHPRGPAVVEAGGPAVGMVGQLLGDL